MAAKGVRIRAPFDYDINNRGVCGGRYNFQPGIAGQLSFVTVVLFNNDNALRDLIVYGWDGFCDAGLGGDWDYSAATFGSFVQAASPLRPLDPTPPGQYLVKQSLVASPYNGNNPDIPNPLGSISFSLDSPGPPPTAPIWIIPPGFALRIGSTASTLTGGITWWYLYE